jgi:hypothetical protein
MRVNLIQSLQEIRDFRAAQGRRYPMKADFTISCHGNNKWMPKLLCTRRLWGAPLRGSQRATRTNGNSPAARILLFVASYKSLTFKRWHSSSGNGLTALSIPNQVSG